MVAGTSLALCLGRQAAYGFSYGRSAGMKILVVDDTRIILSVIETILTQEHHEVITASDGREGYRDFCSHRPEMIITDIEMPWQDGLSMMASIREVQPEVLTLYMTGNPGPYHQRLEDDAELYGAGLLNKPFTRNDLLRAMTHAITHASWGRRSVASGAPLTSAGVSARVPAKHDLASLSTANFQRKSRYAKINRLYADDSYAGGFRAGGRG